MDVVLADHAPATHQATWGFFVADRLAIATTVVLLTAACIPWFASYYYLMPLMTSSGSEEMMMGMGALPR